jgi:diguanylate cyclase (GGDEF)-like protein
MNVALSSLRARFRLGITSRLAISFILVAGLIVAANLVVQQGVLIERTTRIVRPDPAPVVAPAAVVPTPVPAPPAAVPAVVPAMLEGALSALARFDHVSQIRIKDPSPATDSQYRHAGTALNEAIKAVVGTGVSPDAEAAFNRIHAELRSYTARAVAVIQTADTRRATETARTTLLDRMSTWVREPLAGAWTIFGRVVSRQTLVQLNDDIDSLRQHSEALAAPDPMAATQVAEIVSAEQRVQKTLEANASGFRRAQGDDWYKSMSADMAQLVARREASLQLATDLSNGIDALTQHSEQLRHALFAAGTVMAAPRLESPVQLAAPNVVSPIPAPTRTRSTIETRSISPAPTAAPSRRTIAWVSGAAALVMVAMCVGIVLSVVAPVKRLVAATSRISAGQYSVRVARGGITELDSLAIAFNTMADELTLARQTSLQYQQGLEDKIQERTRRLQELSERDPLTGLPNRRHLFTLLAAAIERARLAGHWVGVLFLDIDNFKYINDGLGHAFGDSVLAGMGERLAALTKPFGFAARLGGDEFTVVLEHAMTMADVRAAGEAIVAGFQSPLLIEGRELVVSISVGACAYPIHAQDGAALLKAADMALFRAKSLGRSQLSIFTPELLDLAAAKFAIEQGLRRALDRGEFELFFQPELNAETLEVGLVEALIRWRAPSGELLLPGAFLPVSEESGLAIEIGDWVLRSAISAAASWYRGGWSDARVAINVSPRQLVDDHFIERLTGLLAQFQLPPRCIEIELTESVLQTGSTTVKALYTLRDLGVAVALDDFGTGFSSLSSLEVLPISRVKLDRSLVSGLDVSPRSAAIAEAIIGMCQRLGLAITAEGVERPAQFAYLVRQRSMFIQGFLLVRPVPQNEVLALLPIIQQQARELLITAEETSVTAALRIAPGPDASSASSQTPYLPRTDHSSATNPS